MTTPCRSDCPAGDCAGCAFPVGMARCEPSAPCVQARACARWTTRGDPGQVIDGTVLRVGRFCPLFVDARATPLLEAA
jgi:hypothetical protein